MKVILIFVGIVALLYLTTRDNEGAIRPIETKTVAGAAWYETSVNVSTYCIEGFKFLESGKKNMSQILDSQGKAIPCK